MDNEGKKPISKKKPPVNPAAEYEDIFGNPMKVPEDIKKELDEQGLVPRWGDYKQLKADDGYHEKGWRVYQRKEGGSTSVFGGSSPDRLVRRGSCVLMVKTKEGHKRHKDYLVNKAKSYGKKFRSKTADEMRQKVKNSRLGSQIVDGYEWGDE